jgi:hypothetical protein
VIIGQRISLTRYRRTSQGSTRLRSVFFHDPWGEPVTSSRNGLDAALTIAAIVEHAAKRRYLDG